MTAIFADHKVKRSICVAATSAVPIAIFFVLAGPLLTFTPSLFTWLKPSFGKIFVIIITAGAMMTAIMAVPALLVSWLSAKLLGLETNLTHWVRGVF